MGTPELPAWLETLKAGERSSTPPPGLNASSGYSADDFVDESLLPSWMQSERNDVADNNPSDAIPLRRPASIPAPNTDDAFIPTKGMSASSFIDEQFLPPWLKEKQAATSSTPPESIAASSLLQQDALPDWMRTLPPPAQIQPPPVPSPMPYNQPTNTPQGIAGNDLIDQQAVPEWMAAQNSEVTNNGQAGFAASSLIDRDGLPSWMREGNQEQKKSSAEAFPPQQAGFAQPPHSQFPPVQGQAPYQPQTTSQMQAPGQQQQPNNQPMNASLSAASFIDVNALPEWLRAPSALPAPLQPGTMDNQRQFGVPQRPEHVRVPSRPRNEQGSSEESAVAANAFASMLGVASAAPFFPGQQQRDASMGQAAMPPQPAQSVLPVSINNGGGARYSRYFKSNNAFSNVGCSPGTAYVCKSTRTTTAESGVCCGTVSVPNRVPEWLYDQQYSWCATSTTRTIKYSRHGITFKRRTVENKYKTCQARLSQHDS